MLHKKWGISFQQTGNHYCGYSFPLSSKSGCDALGPPIHLLSLLIDRLLLLMQISPPAGGVRGRRELYPPSRGQRQEGTFSA